VWDLGADFDDIFALWEMVVLGVAEQDLQGITW
jgi:hypothetical protein